MAKIVVPRHRVSELEDVDERVLDVLKETNLLMLKYFVGCLMHLTKKITSLSYSIISGRIFKFSRRSL